MELFVLFLNWAEEVHDFEMLGKAIMVAS